MDSSNELEKGVDQSLEEEGPSWTQGWDELFPQKYVGFVDKNYFFSTIYATLLLQVIHEIVLAKFSLFLKMMDNNRCVQLGRATPYIGWAS